MNGVTLYVDRKHVNYLLNTEELFARSFAQYIATRSGDKIMLSQAKSYSNTLYGARQWDDDDFKPIAAEFDAYFKSIGWIQ